MKLKPAMIGLSNPNQGSFSIQASEAGIYSIVNELGQTIRAFELNAINGYSILLDIQIEGVYFIHSTTHFGQMHQKLS
ncbi:MAG: hypothetical protein IPK03_11115 [Bacteroidetes bacterium]|nr:hypothetical protein [Bacteroidota bacterium]